MQSQLTKRQSQAQDTKRAIFESAIKLFREKGFDKVTVEEITRNAGTAKGSFYTYFRTKSDIIIEEFRTIDGYYKRYQKNLRKLSSATEKIHAFTKAQLRYVRDQVGNATLKILYANNLIEPAADKVLIDPSRYLHTLVRDIIAEGQESGEFRSDKTADKLAYLFNRGMRSVFLDWAISSNDWDLVKEGYAFFEIILLPALRFDSDSRSTQRASAVRS